MSADDQQYANVEEAERRRERVFAEQLNLERDYVSRLYSRLDTMRQETEQKLAQVRKNQAVGGHRNGTHLRPTMRTV